MIEKTAQSLVWISQMTASEQRVQNLLFLRPWKDGHHAGRQPTPLHPWALRAKPCRFLQPNPPAMTQEPWDRILNPPSLSHPRSNSFSLCLSHSLTSWAVFHVDHNGTQHSTIHDPSPCAPSKSNPHGHCIGTWSPDCSLTAGFHAALPRHRKISTVRLSLSLS